MTWLDMLPWAGVAGALAFMICSAARSPRSRVQYTKPMRFEQAMRLPIPLMIPDCQIGGDRYPEMVGHVFNHAAALQLIRERQGC